MKAERRHELKENDLVHAIESGREVLAQHGQRIGLYVIGVVAVAVIGTLLYNSRAKSQRDTWVAMEDLKFTDPAATRAALPALDGLISGSSDSEFVLAALIRKGQVALTQANQPGAPLDKALLEQARSAYNELITRFPNNPVAFGVAHLGLATVAENEFVLDPTHSPAHRDTAQRSLQAVKENAACSTLPLYAVALDRLASLDKTFTPVTFAPPLPPAPDPADTPALTPLQSVVPPAGGAAPVTPPATPPAGGQ